MIEYGTNFVSIFRSNGTLTIFIAQPGHDGYNNIFVRNTTTVRTVINVYKSAIEITE